MLGAELAAVVFGLAAAISWGAGDFSGGLASRHAPLLRVLLTTQLFGLIILLGLALLFQEPLPPTNDLLWGGVAGIAGLVGVGLLYRAMNVGQMGVVAPISALIAATFPVVLSITLNGWPAASQLLGFVLALVGIWLVSGGGSRTRAIHGIGLALLSGCAFGSYFILLHHAGSTAIFWPLVAGRITSLIATLLIAFPRGEAKLPPPRLLLLLILPSALEIIGNACFVVASQQGRLDVASVLSSLYPASTVVLARLILKERMSRSQALGVVVVLGAIALIAS